MSFAHVTMALLIERGCPPDLAEQAMNDQLGGRVPPDSVEEVLHDIDAAIAQVAPDTPQ